MEVKSKGIFSESRQEERLVDFQVDSATTDLIKEMYLSLKKQKTTELTKEQLNWIKKVEQANSKIRKTKENAFNEFLKSSEKVIHSTLSLDFSNKVSICTEKLDERNILNYITFAFNMLIEKIESSMVSMKVVNAMLTALPLSAFIVTDTKGRIRFISDVGESLIAVQHNELLNQSIYPLFKSDNELIKNCMEHFSELTNATVQFVLNERTTPVSLTAIHCNTEADEIAEVVWIIKTREEAEKEMKTPQQPAEGKVPSLNSITELLQLLKSKSSVIDSQYLIAFLEESVDIIKKDEQVEYTDNEDTANTLDPINIEFIYDRIIENLRFNEGFNDVTFYKDIVHEHDVHGDAVLFYSVLQKLITTAITYRHPENHSTIQFTVRDFSSTHLLVTVQFTCGEVSLEELNHVFEKNVRDVFNTNTKNSEYLSVREAIHQLKGSFDIYNKSGKDVVLTISLPY